MAISLRLLEYNWNGTAYAAGATLTFTPGPKSVSKSVDVQWRVMHRGRRKLKKAKFRVRETTTWTIAGSCQGSYTESLLRNTIEFYAKRNSKFKVIIDENTPQIFLTPGSGPNTYEIVFVVFKNVKFTQTEGKIGWFDYTIDLERVNCENMSGYSDPWTCTV